MGQGDQVLRRKAGLIACIADEDKMAILGENAAKLFGLKSG